MLDAVRGVAIAMVFYFHILENAVHRWLPAVAVTLRLSWSGVDLFFVLSGYLLGGILMRNRQSNHYFSTFYGRRFLRILVPYWILIALFFWWYPNPGNVWVYLAFLQNIVSGVTNSWGPVFVLPSWSLAVEEQFYLILPLLIWICPPKRLPYALGALILAAPISRLIASLTFGPVAAYMFMPCRMDSLFLGVLIAWGMHNVASRKWLESNTKALLAVVSVGAVFAVYALFEGSSAGSPLMVGPGLTIMALLYGSIVTLLLTKRVSLPPYLAPLSWLGLGAYSIYLFHLPLQQMTASYFGPHITDALAVMIAVAGVSFACWRLIEAPLIALGHRVFRY